MTSTRRQHTTATSHGSVAVEETGQGHLQVMEAIVHEPKDIDIFCSTVRLRVAKIARVAERAGLAMARFLSWYY